MTPDPEMRLVFDKKKKNPVEVHLGCVLVLEFKSYYIRLNIFLHSLPDPERKTIAFFGW